MSLQTRISALITALGADYKKVLGSTVTASTATLTPTSATRMWAVSAQAAALTVANPTGTWVDGQPLLIRIEDNGTARAISWGSNYRAVGTTLPTTTVVGKQHYIGAFYNAVDTKWDVTAVAAEA